MSIVKLDLRSQHQQLQLQNQCAKQPPAPLVKIDLTPEKQNERKSSEHNGSSNNCNGGINQSANFATSSGNNSYFANHISTSSSNQSLPATNLTTAGSCSSIHARFSPIQTNQIGSFMNAPHSIGSSPTQSKANTPLILSSPYNSTSPHNTVHNCINIGMSSNVIQSIAATTSHLNGVRNSLQQEIKNSQNSTEVSHDESLQNIQQLQRKLEQQAQENVELREQLKKEKSKTKMIITENLTMQEELRKAQQKLREYESLNLMRQSQAISHRASWMRASPNKKPIGTIHASNIRGVHNPSSKMNKNEISADFSYDKYSSPMIDPQMCQQIHQNQLSQHSILDILHNLNCEDDSFLTDRQNKDAACFDKLKSVKVSQFNKSKTTSLSTQLRRRSNLTPSFSRFEAVSSMPKKVY